jgi:hypothetical protein
VVKERVMASPDRPPPTAWKRHPIFARVLARLGPAMDAQGAAEHRRALRAGLAGRVLEVGAGNGLNFPHYPPAVTEVLAVEPEPTYGGWRKGLPNGHRSLSAS